MAKTELTTCDGCGQETREKKPQGWMTINIVVGDNPSADVIHVDSWNCLLRYAEKKSKEQGEDDN